MSTKAKPKTMVVPGQVDSRYRCRCGGPVSYKSTYISVEGGGNTLGLYQCLDCKEVFFHHYELQAVGHAKSNS